LRAKAIKPAFTIRSEEDRIIGEICKRLDYLPLAIELASARVRMFEPAQLLTRLSTRLDVLTDGARDLPTRQRTLRNTIAWSYNLLSSEEQTLFRRLGIFAGGCTLEAAEQVAGDGLYTPVLDLLQSLADKSLVMIDIHDDEPRCSMLETLHQYAIERLEQSGESEILGKRHAHYFASYAESIEPTFSMRIS
jgi:predicted ATPase